MASGEGSQIFFVFNAKMYSQGLGKVAAALRGNLGMDAGSLQGFVKGIGA